LLTVNLKPKVQCGVQRESSLIKPNIRGKEGGGKKQEQKILGERLRSLDSSVEYQTGSFRGVVG